MSNTKPKTIFRYPGGKYKAIKYIQPFWEQIDHDEYREPFVGGGSVFIAKPSVPYNWINDLDKEIIAFYKVISDKKKREILINKLLALKIDKPIYEQLYFSKPKDNLNKAFRYYILNRCSFSGITRWNSFIGDVRYNITNAQHLIRDVGPKLANTKITSQDFEKVIIEKSKGKKGVFLFLDPPYAESRQIVAYNVTFSKEDHLRLAKLLKKTKYPFLLTYDDCEFVRELYKWANLYSKTWTYSVANSRVHHNPRENGNELFISNFPIVKEKQLKLL
ncbi:DNA adenine methylase [Candidatus Wolfebacteria bacterium]|nr:DNA adenine methylase [Candidatus Wolfebacteria bacterium]